MGAPPALIWCADHPKEVAGLLYIEAPVMLGDVLRKIITYTPEAMEHGSMWWWLLPLAPGVPQRLVAEALLQLLTAAHFEELKVLEPALTKALGRMKRSRN